MAEPRHPPTLARKLGLADVTLIVMGGIIGSGIFVNPAVVAARTGSAAGALGAWLLGGAIALAGAFIYAELGARRPEAGGQYAYLREAFHPALAFAYAWALLLLIQTGGKAASGFGSAMVPVLFAYGGWQTAAFVGGEVRDASRTLPRGMVLGVIGVVLLYVAVNIACLRVLGASGLAGTPAPAAALMRAA